MAVIPNFPGVKVSVRIAGSDEDCIEYDDPDPDTAFSVEEKADLAVSKHIECRDGANFSICIEVKEGQDTAKWFPDDQHALSYDVYIDGSFALGKFISKDNFYDGVAFYECEGIMLEGLVADKARLKRFKFAPIQTEDGDWDGNMKSATGSIEMHIYWCKLGEESATTSYSTGDGLGSNGKIELNEKSIKGGNFSHGTCLDTEEIVDINWGTFDTLTLNNDEPLASFCFKYRSKEVLQISGIIPKAGLPAGAAQVTTSGDVRVKPEGPDLTREELEVLAEARLIEISGGVAGLRGVHQMTLKELQVLARARMQSTAGVKREREDDPDSQRRDARRRRIVEPKKEKNEGVVDLTDD